MYVYLPTLSIQFKPNVSKSTIPLDILGLALIAPEENYPGGDSRAVQDQLHNVKTYLETEELPGRRQLYRVVGIGRMCPDPNVIPYRKFL